MTATDELRRLLDERGVEWGNVRRDGSESNFLTEWQFDNNGGKAVSIEWAVGGLLSVEIHRYMHLAPAQAVEATLGRETCHMTLRDDIYGHAYQDVYECSECGEQVIRETYMGKSEPPKFCPNCGREVAQR